MSVPVEQIKPGAVFQFRTAQRRVVAITSGRTVEWKYSDEVKRAGKIGGKQFLHYFAGEANELTGTPKSTYSDLEAELQRHKDALRIATEALSANSFCGVTIVTSVKFYATCLEYRADNPAARICTGCKCKIALDAINSALTNPCDESNS